MDTQSLALMVAAASLVTGLALGWLLMRGRVGAAAAQAKSAVQGELVQAREHARALDAERQQALARCEAATLHADQSRLALELARQEHNRLAPQAARAASLEASLAALQAQADAGQQQLQRVSMSHAESAESLRLGNLRLAESEDQNTSLRHELAELSATLDALKARPAPKPLPAPTQLPVLETEVIALQDLAKTIEEEFLRLADAHRHHAAAVAALDELQELEEPG